MGRKEWIGKIYPKGTKDAQFSDEYVKLVEKLNEACGLDLKKPVFAQPSLF
jgi:hypothetical protein